ncbi:hypothetical protein BGX31_010203 [Mortierella sp. GBA43]|nr:hypothetical protein BGX31_010203 [Mortierella sp. GBA43]
MASGDQKAFAKGAVIQADSASLIALAAEVAKHDEKFQRVKGSGGIKVPRSVKKPTVWQRQNPGLARRTQKHDATFSSEYPDADSARKAAMERKAKMYEMLERGGDVPDRLREELLVEFEYKDRDHSRERDRRGYGSSESDSDDRLRRDVFRGRRRDRGSGRRSRSRSSDYESAALARDPKDFTNDPWVEHVDEFGRTKLVRQSEIPRPEPVEEDYTLGIHNPANPFPVFRNRDAIDKQEWIEDATGEMMRSANAGMAPGYSMANTVRHYDNTKERRAQGVGFYAFSHDEEERQRQMKELRDMRSQTERKRAQHRSLRDKRRDEIEARKRIIQQKRLKSLASTITA